MKFILVLTLVLGAYEEVTANPIRRVVNMLEAMRKKVTEEGEQEEELYEKFVCYCKTNEGELTKSIEVAQAKISQLETQVEEDSAAKNQVDEELSSHKADRIEAQDSLGSATSLREKEASAYAKESGEQGQNIEALKKAIVAIEQGMGNSFVQTEAGARFKKLVLSSKVALSGLNRDMVTLFLSNSANAPQSSEIVGILKEMKDEMSRDLGDIVSQEDEAKTRYNELSAAKKKEISAATKAIEEKTERSGNLAVRIVEAKDDLKDTVNALSGDEQFQVNLRRDCKKKEDEFGQRQKVRSEELQAISETIKVLNDDDALDLFKKTLPGKNSFLQASAMDNVRTRARNIIDQARRSYKGNGFDFISLALAGKKVDFSKVIFMIEDMVKVLAQEQVDDESHKSYCEKEFDTSDDKKQSIERRVESQENEQQEAEAASSNLATEIESLHDGIKALDKQVAEATEQRKEEHAEFVKTQADNQAAVDLIAFAKNRMQKFYNPKLYKAPAKRELSEDEKIYTNFGGELEPTPAPGGIAGTGVTVFLQRAAPEAAPGTWNEGYKNKGAESGGVLAMMDMLINDVKKDMHTAEMEEKDAQEDYEQLMADSQKKRALDSKSITTKETAKAEADSVAQETKSNVGQGNADLQATKEYIANLHKSCDFLLENFDFRKAARAQETDALKNAKAVLQGANYSLIQRHTVASTVTDLDRRRMLQNKLHDACEDMCRELNQYPNCQCPNFVQPDATPGVMTWDELFAKFDELKEQGREQLKQWNA